MVEIKDKQMCSGCHACMAVCPKRCITMRRDEEGFLYPEVNKEQCISCGLCEKVCQALNPMKSKSLPTAYAAYNKNEEQRMRSSSGGVFTLIAEYIIDKGGAVFGAAFDEDFNVHHICVTKKEDLRFIRGSKYLQSTVGSAYIDAKRLLDAGKYVLFTGTPCQTDGLLHFLRKQYDKLFTQDIICHGVPSPMVWQEYLRYQTSAFGGDLDRKSLPTFRRKDEGWKRYSVSLRFARDTEYRNTLDKDLFMKAFLNNLCLRPSCYSCHSKTLNRNSDITLADFWGIDGIMPEMDDDKGTSLVFVNSAKGRKLFDALRDKMKCREVDIRDAVKCNQSAHTSVAMPKKRERFMRFVGKRDFGEITEKYAKAAFHVRLAVKMKQICKAMLKTAGLLDK